MLPSWLCCRNSDIRVKGRRDSSYYFRAMPFNCYVRNSSYSLLTENQLQCFLPKSLLRFEWQQQVLPDIISKYFKMYLSIPVYNITKNIFLKKTKSTWNTLFPLSLLNNVVFFFSLCGMKQKNEYHVSTTGIWLETSRNAVLVTDKVQGS